MCDKYMYKDLVLNMAGLCKLANRDWIRKASVFFCAYQAPKMKVSIFGMS